jgi:hypothetical protein
MTDLRRVPPLAQVVSSMRLVWLVAAS